MTSPYQGRSRTRRGGHRHTAVPVVSRDSGHAVGAPIIAAGAGARFDHLGGVIFLVFGLLDEEGEDDGHERDDRGQQERRLRTGSTGLGHGPTGGLTGVQGRGGSRSRSACAGARRTRDLLQGVERGRAVRVQATVERTQGRRESGVNEAARPTDIPVWTTTRTQVGVAGVTIEYENIATAMAGIVPGTSSVFGPRASGTPPLTGPSRPMRTDPGRSTSPDASSPATFCRYSGSREKVPNIASATTAMMTTEMT